MGNLFKKKPDPQLEQDHYSNPADGYWWKPDILVWIERDSTAQMRHLFVIEGFKAAVPYLESLGYRIRISNADFDKEVADLRWFWESKERIVPRGVDAHTYTGYEVPPGKRKQDNMPWCFEYVEVRSRKVGSKACVFLGLHELGLHAFGVTDHSHDKDDAGHPTSYKTQLTARDKNTLRMAAERRFRDAVYPWSVTP